MKWIILFFAVTFTLSYNKQSGDKIALIVAIGDYPKASGWSTLGSFNDGEMLRSALLKKGFKKQHIHLLGDQSATRKGILRAIQQHLVKNAVRGGTAVFHFSGHGQQVQDDDGDELDGYDEALVPYDSPLHFQKGIYEGENLLRDEDLGTALLPLRKALGPEGQLLCLLDACHSGTGIRGWGRARGTAVKMGALEKSSPQQKLTNEFNTMEHNALAAANFAPTVAFFASSARELNYEARNELGQSCGPLSYAFSKALVRSSQHSTYRELFDRIRMEMVALSPRQTPQAEGQLDRLIFGKKTQPGPVYFRPVQQFGEIVIIDGGLLSGLSDNTQVAFYPAGTRDTSRAAALARGVVRHPQLTSAEVHLEAPVPAAQLLTSVVFIEKLAYRFPPLRVQMEIDEQSFRTDLQNGLAALSYIEFSGQDPDLFFSQQDDRLLISSKDGGMILDSELRWSPFIVQKIRQYVQSVQLRQLEIESSGLKLTMEIIPLQSDPKDANKLIPIQLRYVTGPDGVLRFKNETPFRIRISNPGPRAAYFSLLDIQPDHQVNVLLPESGLGRVAEEYFLRPGESSIFPEPSEVYEDFWTFAPPFGNELFKLIATDQVIDWRPLLSTRAMDEQRPPAHPLASLLHMPYVQAPKNRGSTSVSISPGESQVQSFVFSVVE